MENKQVISELFNRYLEGQTSVDETNYLLGFLGTDQGSALLNELVNEKFDEGVEIAPALLASIYPFTDRVGQNLNRFIQENSTARPVRKLNWGIIAIAASIIISIGAVLIYQFGKEKPLSSSTIAAVDADPGGNRATLTLANGNSIDLDDVANGNLTEQAGVQISKTTDGQLVYSIANSNNNPGLTNTITTPNGGQYQVRLPDGSKVWLNATSSLTYPISFANQKERKVELSGEAYFEVAHNTAQPFRVFTGSQTVEVLGTHFNINSYTDEKNVATTLAEGSVKVSTAGNSKVLKPGDQSLVAKGTIAIRQADLETVLAWKDGNMIFKSAVIEDIMKQVQRWYDIQVVYEGKIPQRLFSGGISRQSKLSVLLSILKDSGINYELKETSLGKQLTIKP